MARLVPAISIPRTKTPKRQRPLAILSLPEFVIVMPLLSPSVVALIPPPSLPELVSVMLLLSTCVSASIPPLLSLPELVIVALPPEKVSAPRPAPPLVPELVAVALPPPSVNDAKPTAVPELVVVAFWFVPVALLVRRWSHFRYWCRCCRWGVTVQANCAAAGQFASSAAEDRGAALKNVARVTSNALRYHRRGDARCGVACRSVVVSVAGKMCLRMNPSPQTAVLERRSKQNE
jgi:hypothetical protein